ncbi:hypothetical protein N7488_008578 [Penicillium malachiteum]|nr:hypothetical protein N7488_008578 [Penicillium malachiteum]
MKRSRRQRDKEIESPSGEDGTSAATPSDSQNDDTAYETDLTELDDPTHVRKRFRSDEKTALGPGFSSDVGGLYEDPLDEGGVDLSEIPEDFDKAPGTIERRERIESRWKRYCASQVRSRPKEQKWHEVEGALRQASNNDMYRFLRWCLQLARGEDGRHIKGIQKASTLETDWKNLRLYYQKLTKITIKDEDGSEIQRGMKWLVKEFDLDTQPGKKTPVYIEDIAPFNETILSTQEKKFHLGFQRIQYLYSASKKRHVEFTVQRLADFSLERSSRRPTRAYDRTYSRGDQKIPRSDQIQRLRVAGAFGPGKVWLTELVKDIPTIQRTTQMSKSAISTLLVTFGEIYGWKRAFYAYQFRYRSGKVLNKSGNPHTFLNHYHPLQINTDIIQIIYGLDPDVELMRAVTQ